LLESPSKCQSSNRQLRRIQTAQPCVAIHSQRSQLTHLSASLTAPMCIFKNKRRYDIRARLISTKRRGSTNAVTRSITLRLRILVAVRSAKAEFPRGFKITISINGSSFKTIVNCVSEFNFTFPNANAEWLFRKGLAYHFESIVGGDVPTQNHIVSCHCIHIAALHIRKTLSVAIISHKVSFRIVIRY